MLRWRSVASFVLVSVFALLTGCGKGNQISTATGNPSGSSPDPPAFSGYAAPGTFGVVALSPAPGATQVPTTTAKIQITFSAALDQSTVSSSTIQVTGPNSSAITGSLAYSAGSTVVTFTITYPLQIGATYTVTVSGVKSSAGAAMASPFTSTFSTPPPPQPIPAKITDCPYGEGAPLGIVGTVPGCIQYLSELLRSPTTTAGNGNIVMDLSGNMSVQIGSTTANSDFTVQFCPAYNSIRSANVPACFDVGVVSSDSQGNVNAPLKFPRSGSWAGDFRVLNGSTVMYQSWAFPDKSVGLGAPYARIVETLQPETTVNGTGVTQALEQEPFTFGALADFIGLNMSVYLNGASLKTYAIYESQSLDVGCSCANQLSTITPDVNPSTNDFTTRLPGGGDIFTVEPQDKARAGWIGGFSVP